MCISSVQQMNGNSIKFSLSTQTRRVVKSSQAKSLYCQYWSGCKDPFEFVKCLLLFSSPLLLHILPGQHIHQPCYPSKIFDKPPIVVCKAQKFSNIFYILRLWPTQHSIHLFFLYFDSIGSYDDSQKPNCSDLA